MISINLRNLYWKVARRKFGKLSNTRENLKESGLSLTKRLREKIKEAVEELNVELKKEIEAL